MKNSLGLEASQAKPVLQNNTSFHRIISCSGFTLALLLLGDLDNSIPISIFSLLCEKKTIPCLTKMLSDLRLQSDKQTLIVMICNS